MIIITEKVMELEGDSDANHRALGKIAKNQEKKLMALKIWGRIETVQTTALMRKAKIFS